jgi:hypothetical protein
VTRDQPQPGTFLNKTEEPGNEVVVFVDTLNSFRRLLGSVISFPHSVKTVSFEDKEIPILENVFVFL